MPDVAGLYFPSLHVPGPLLPGLRWLLLLPALAILGIGPAAGEAGRRPQCNELGSWRVCYNATMQLTDASRQATRREIEKDGRKIGGSANMAISILDSQLRAELQLSFLGASYPVKVVADGEVVDTISPAGNQIVDLKRSFGEALQRLRRGDEAKKLPPVKNLKVVMVVDGEELVLLDAALAHTEEAIQGLFRAAVMLGTLSPLSELARDVPPGLAPRDREPRRAGPPDRPPGKDSKVAKKPDGPPGKDGDAAKQSDGPPAVALPTTIEECRAIPDVVQKRLGIGKRIDHMHFFAREAIIADCERSKFVDAQVKGLDLLRRHRTTLRPNVLLYRDLARTIPAPKDPPDCKRIWERVKAFVAVDDIDGEEAVSSPILRECYAGRLQRAYELMTRHVDNEVKRELDRFSRPGGPFGDRR